MPNRDQRRSKDPALDKWLSVEDADGNVYEIHMRDISARDEHEYLAMTNGTVGGLCDLFFEAKVSLTNIAGLIWAYRRKNGEKKLALQDVEKTVNMATIETLELHDPADEDEDPAPDDPQAKLAKIRAEKGQEGFGDRSETSVPSSEPSTA